MPFGRVFAALCFGILCSWLGLRVFAEEGLPARAAGPLLVVLGLTLAIVVLRRGAWGRWFGVACAALLIAFTLSRIAADTAGMLENVLLLGSLATLVLLVVPATGAG
ncbi:MAG TPA: hypothetical protein VJS92_18525, partial [Candidatus Polarisedimenticolaceae bacterium]|nr:hypothetical protein [Candidatus Polarisedimenticolaceae bacterium]